MITFLIDGGIYALAGAAAAAAAVIYLAIRFAVLRIRPVFTNVQRLVLILAVIALTAGFLCSFRMVNHRPCDYSSIMQFSALEKETDVAAVKIKCFLFDCIYECTVCEDDGETVISYYDAKKEKTKEKYLDECLEVHRRCGDDILYDDDIITVRDAAGDTAWVYVSCGDRLEIVKTCSSGDMERLAACAYDDVRKGDCE